jgi:hypothetical protein
MLSLSEIRRRSVEFVQQWKDESSEDAEAKTFWDAFFQVFGQNRRQIARYEKLVMKAGSKAGYIDLFWPSVCIVEHKSRGKDLDRAFMQALDYFPGLTAEQLPRYVIVSDFARIRLYDLDEKTQDEFVLEELPEKTHLFGFISGYVQRKFRDEDPVNVKAAELMGHLHDALKDSGYTGHPLEVFLVRILFCLFADDAGIFPRDQFVTFIDSKTREDGLDVGSQISLLFQILNTPEDMRHANLDDELKSFPYVNGDLFSEPLPIPTFDSTTRGALLKCAYFDWTNVSPAVFGAMFQSVMDPVKRRNIGAHYTSERNILKVISGLFLDALTEEFEKSKNSESMLRALHTRMSDMRFLDPSCGCGNFLVVTYKELRLLEIKILKQIEKVGNKGRRGLQSTDVSTLSRLSVHAMHGIEIEEFPARIAEVALWLMDHQMNVEMAEAFGGYFVRLPLTDGPTIRNTDALELNWKSEVINTDADAQWFILGNPPFIGSKMMIEQQRAQIKKLFSNTPGSGVLDYVTGWYQKAAALIHGTNITCAFVSTNSISQGEQVGILWKFFTQKYGIKIHFAHRTFRWSNEGKGVAAVHCVIVGFGCYDRDTKYLYDYESVDGDPVRQVVLSINGYLTAGEQILILSRPSPVCNVPAMMFGNMPLDGGHLLLTPDERNELVRAEPIAAQYIKKCIGAWEFINSVDRYCLWMKGIAPSELRKMPIVMKRVEEVKQFRLASIAPSTREHADRPWEFRDTRHPDHNYFVCPRVSSENRLYIPIGFVGDDIVTSDSNLMIHDATEYHFGVLSSTMHMAWVRQVCGRLKSDYRYSKDLVYNNYPWPANATETMKEAVIEKAKAVLQVRSSHHGQSLADLYHQTTMPADLRKAHQALDKAVDLCYRKEPFKTERERVEYLFEIYRKLTVGFGVEAVNKSKRINTKKQL